MSKSVGIILTAGTISFGSRWMESGTPPIKAGMAWLGLSLVMDGLEQLSPEGAVGLSIIVMITTLVTPIKGKSPADTLIDLVNNKTKVQKGAT